MHRRPRSRFALLAAGLLAAATACSSGGGAGATANAGSDKGGSGGTVRVMMYPAQSYRLPVLLAQEKGLFKKHGLKLDITEQPANLQGMQGLSATKSDVGIVTVGTLGQGWQAGTKGAFFCGGINVLQTTLMAPVNSKLPSTKDGADWKTVLKSLEGKKVGIQTPVGSGLQLIFAEALKEAGVKNVTYVNLGGGSSAALAALKKGSVDVAQLNPTGTQFAQYAKSGKPLLYMPDGPKAYKDYYGSGWVGTESFLKQHPQTAKAFCDTLGESLKLLRNNADRDAALKILTEDAGVTKPVAELVLDDTYADFDTHLDKATLTTTLDAYVRLGILKHQPKPTWDALVDVPK
ncbi:ABC transporter substrate-binding protein [Streptomyces sp. CA-106131]|uniref:ABC transporter substrate-binding protein n=1 Tax=Streptomyces sp. CA-106131 TaxID=3240045 RepID=UPI003D8B4779